MRRSSEVGVKDDAEPPVLALEIAQRAGLQPQPLVFSPDRENGLLIEELRRRHEKTGLEGSVDLLNLLSRDERDRIAWEETGMIGSLTRVFEDLRQRDRVRGGSKGGRKRNKAILSAAMRLAQNQDRTRTAKEAWEVLSKGSLAYVFKLRIDETKDGVRRLTANGEPGGITLDTFRKYWRDAQSSLSDS